MNNPIPRNGLFATKTLAEIQDYIEALPTEARATAYLVMMMTLNSCNQLVEEEFADEVDYPEVPGAPTLGELFRAKLAE